MESCHLRRITVLSLLLLLVGFHPLTGQWRSTNTSLYNAIFQPTPAPPGGENVYSPDQTSILVSGFVGFNNNMNLGNFTPDITKCNCSFDGSFGLAKIGLAFGGDITYVFSREWAAMAKVFYDDKHTNETFEAPRQMPIKVGSQIITREVQTEQKAKVDLSYLTFGVFMRYQPRLERWYVFAGPGIAKNLTNKLEQTETILTEGLTYLEGGGTERIVSQDAILGRENIRAEAMIGAGYDFMMGPRLFLSPEIHVAYPITKISNADDNWKVLTFRVAIGLKYEAF